MAAVGWPSVTLGDDSRAALAFAVMGSAAEWGDGGDAFERIVGHLDYPMYVVTTIAGGRRAGCLVGFATQASIHPRRFLVGISDQNHTYGVASDAIRLAVHVLAPDALALANLFGEQTGDDTDKFAQCDWRPGPEDVPVITDATAWFSGRILERLRLGDHVAFLIEPDSGACDEPFGAFVKYSGVRELEPGHPA
jgi:flavin reductase (DIM6/NTAB) family NADH-FMN oxidoreductase RutF